MNTSCDPGALQGTLLYLDCFAGIAGDMMLGALLDLGVPEQVVRQALSLLPLSGWTLSVLRVRRGVMMGTKIEVAEHGHPHDHAHGHDHGHAHEAHPAHVHYADIRRMIVGAGLDADVVRRALGIFDRIAVVEAEMHGLKVEAVTFHEVGATDSIIDIVGTAAALSWLRPARVFSRVVPLGGGMVRTAHGLLPVPAPATLALLRGAPVVAGGAEVELTTPTGAGILAATVDEYGPLPAMRVVAAGFGAGTRELPDRPNLLRVVAGAALSCGGHPGGDSCVVIEANLDDMNPELCEPLMEALFAAGARDVWYTPVHMKKNRPGLLVSALCDPPLREKVTTALLRESTTLGVRSHEVERTMLQREQWEVETRYGRVLVKVGQKDGQIWNIAPEYASCRARAREHDVPVKQVYAAALCACYNTPKAAETER